MPQAWRLTALSCAAVILHSAFCILHSAEARLELPDPLVVGLAQNARLVLADPPGDIKGIQPPAVEGVRWGRARMEGQEVRIINGQQSKVYRLAIGLTPERTGPLAVGAFTITFADGSSVQTAAAATTVTEPRTDLGAKVVARAEAAFEPARIVPGESCELVLRLFLRPGQQVERPGIEPPPSAIRLGERSQQEGEVVGTDGQRWTQVTWRWPLTAAAPGDLPVQGQQQVLVVEPDEFGFAMFARRRALTIPVKPATLTVLPLPAEGRPDDFTGLVGPATLTARLERSRIAAGEGTALVVALAARRPELARAPRLALPAGIQAYAKEPAPGKDGVREFRWDLVPGAPGDYVLPALSVPYFDAQAKGYRRAESQPLTLNVIPGRSRDLGLVGAPASTAAAPAAVTRAAPDLAGFAPMRDGAAATTTPTAALLAGLLALAAGAGAGLLVRLAARGPRRAHRGRVLATALAARDATAASQALAAWTPDELPPPAAAERARLATALESVRFGGQPWPDGLSAGVLEQQP